MVTAWEQQEGVSLNARRIRRVLERRPAMCVGELGLRLDMPENAVRAELAALMERGEVERLRPVSYDGEDQDFYRLPGVGWTALGETGRKVTPTMRDLQEHIRLAGEAMAWRLA